MFINIVLHFFFQLHFFFSLPSPLDEGHKRKSGSNKKMPLALLNGRRDMYDIEKATQIRK